MEINLFASQTYKDRRDALKKKLGKGVVLILGNDESSINFKDNWYPFRQDSTFLYYFGLNLPGLTAMIDIDNDRDIIFGNELSIDDIVWTGPQPSLAELAEKVAVTEVLPTSRIADHVNTTTLYLPPYRPEHSVKLSDWTGKGVAEAAGAYSVELIKAMAEQRSVKSQEELEEINKAVTITSEMHLAVMKAARPGMKEHELVGVAMRTAAEHNVSLSFPPIMTINGSILHNHYYGNKLEEGQMLLFDGGTESPRNYAGDMTRTFPVGGRFDTRQKALYDIVHSAHSAAVEALKPGAVFKDIHLLAAKKLVEGLTEVGIMKGDADAAVNAGAHTMFFQCGLGHMMGLDVHDMENYGEQYIGYTDTLVKSKEFGLKSLRLGKAVEKGYVVTIEPGIYIIPELIDMYKADNKFAEFINYQELESYRDFGGIRVEDDYVITESGSSLLGKPLVRSSEEVEAVRTEAVNNEKVIAKV